MSNEQDADRLAAATLQRLAGGVVTRGKKRALPTPSPPSSDADSDTSDAALHHNHTHASGALCVNYGSIASQGTTAIGMGTLVSVSPPPAPVLTHTHTNTPQTPRRKPGRAPTTPVDAPPLVVLRLRIADTGVVVPVCGVDTLAQVLRTVKTAVSAEVRAAAVGLEGAGEMREWVRMGEGWRGRWCEEGWEALKRRAGRFVRVPVVDVAIVWVFDE